MATLKQKIEAEAAGRKLLEEGGIPQPDGVEYGHTCIRFLWNEQKVAVVIEIDEPPADFETVGESIEMQDLVSGLADLVDLEGFRGRDLCNLEDPANGEDLPETDEEAA